jgi:hypothetical protein
VKRQLIALLLLFLVGSIQIRVFFGIYRPLWPFLRRHAPLLLAGRGMPLFLASAVLLVAIPGLWAVVFAAQFMVPVGNYLLGGAWAAGLMLGLKACVAYYAPIDKKEKPTP